MEKTSISRADLLTILESENITTTTTTKAFDMIGRDGDFAIIVSCTSFTAGSFAIKVRYSETDTIDSNGNLENPKVLPEGFYQTEDSDNNIIKKVPTDITGVMTKKIAFERINSTGSFSKTNRYYDIVITPTGASGTNKIGINLILFKATK